MTGIHERFNLKLVFFSLLHRTVFHYDTVIPPTLEESGIDGLVRRGYYQSICPG